jgi:aspartate carbamoyltransferase catalytic subunit
MRGWRMEAPTLEKMQHILRVEQFERAWVIKELLPVVEQLAAAWPSEALSGVEIFNLFQQPSFLTRLAFSRAIRRLGGQHEQADFENAFTAEGRRQSIEDEVRILNGLDYAGIVVRAANAGGAERAAAVSRIPVINGGEPAHRAALGTAQHPTQALADLVTIYRARGGIDALHLAIVPGDGASVVVVQSLAMLLGNVCADLEISLVVRPALAALYDELATYLGQRGVACRKVNDVRQVAGSAEVLYFAQANNLHLGVAERYRPAGTEPGVFVLDEEVLALVPSSSVIMHPLPRNIGAGQGVPEELPERFTDDPRVRCFEQARMKYVVAGALLYLLLRR